MNNLNGAGAQLAYRPVFHDRFRLRIGHGANLRSRSAPTITRLPGFDAVAGISGTRQIHNKLWNPMRDHAPLRAPLYNRAAARH